MPSPRCLVDYRRRAATEGRPYKKSTNRVCRGGPLWPPVGAGTYTVCAEATSMNGIIFQHHQRRLSATRSHIQQ